MTNPEIERIHEDVVTLPNDTTYDELLSRLIDGKIPVDAYGVGNAKTLSHLLAEINEGESIVTIDVRGIVRRQVTVLWVDVICTLSNGDVHILKEDRQEFKDGRVKVRNLTSSLGEKLKPSETINEGVMRALQEEIGAEEVDNLYETGYEEKTFIPETFPGIESTYSMHKFACVIPEQAFVPEGYVEKQHDKTNYYTWERIHTNAQDLQK